MSLTGIVIKRPLLLIVIFTVLILFGVQSYLSLNYNLLPKIEVPTVSISTLIPELPQPRFKPTLPKNWKMHFLQ